MGTKTLDEREVIIGRVEELFLMGHRTPWQVFQHTERTEVANYDTAKRYLNIVRRRLRNRWKNIDAEALLRRELQEMQMLERVCWAQLEACADNDERVAATQALLKVKAYKARLLGLDASIIRVQKPIEVPSSVWDGASLNENTRRLLAQKYEAADTDNTPNTP